MVIQFYFALKIENIILKIKYKEIVLDKYIDLV